MQEVNSIEGGDSIGHFEGKKGPMNMCLITKATRYGLGGPGIESRWGARFSAPVQTGPGDHPAFYTMGTGSFPGGKSAGAWL